MAEDIKSLDQLKDAVTASVGGVQGASGEEQRILPAAAPREPQRDSQGRSYATGKRKDAVARVWVKPGSGKVTVNGKVDHKQLPQPERAAVAVSAGRGPQTDAERLVAEAFAEVIPGVNKDDLVQRGEKRGRRGEPDIGRILRHGH